MGEDPKTVSRHPNSRLTDAQTTKLLTFETWVRRLDWYDYALANPDLIPYPLIDRSPCQNPFFDPFAGPGDRRAVISGLCRSCAMRNLHAGDRFIYITRIDARLGPRLGLVIGLGSHYLAVAALRIMKVWQSHRDAAADFSPRQYVAEPESTPYPPNLASADNLDAAAARVCSIVHDDKDRAHLPDDADDRM